jgi:predicted RNase H-like HicB family nuclease
VSEILVRVLADDLDGGYVAECVGLPGLLSRGDTVAETIRRFADAYVGYAETLLVLDRELA